MEGKGEGGVFQISVVGRGREGGCSDQWCGGGRVFRSGGRGRGRVFQISVVGKGEGVPDQCCREGGGCSRSVL